MKNTIIARRSFKRWVAVNKTEPKLKKLIEMVIDDMGNGKINTQRLLDNVESDELKDLITEQERIGWLEFYKGLITKRFCDIQTEYYKKLNDRRSEENLEELPRRFTGEYWTKEFIKHIVYFALVQWQIRNDHVHEEKEYSDKKEKRKRINDEIIKWYEMKDTLDERMKYLFKIPLMFRCMKSIRAKEAWIRTIRLENEIMNNNPEG